MNASDHISVLAARGQHHFSTEEYARLTGTEASAARAALRRLRVKGLIASPHRSFHVIVPPEYRDLGCLPADQFLDQLMHRLELDYYLALLTAARYHGAAHQQPHTTYAIVQKNRPPISCGRVRVSFVARRNVQALPVMEFNTPRGRVRVSSPATTAFDLVGYPSHAGGLDNVATVLQELSESITPEDLNGVAELSPTSWTQRLGYLFDRVGAEDHAQILADRVQQIPHKTTPLDPRLPRHTTMLDRRWKLLVNVSVEPEL